jgi:16S rRNA (adenine1518-N6/adenine1519-N6)-dimethyltransferase
MRHIPRKRFGQHFLADGGIIDAIVNAIGPQAALPRLHNLWLSDWAISP